MGNFTVLAGTHITSTGNTIIYDNIGAGTYFSGFTFTTPPQSTPTGPGIITGAQHLNNTAYQSAMTDLTAAYNQVAAQTFTQNLSGQVLGGQVKSVTPGVYRFNGNATLSDTLTLNAQGNPNAVFIFQVLGNLTTLPNALISMRQGARSPNIFWQVGNSVIMGAGTNIKGSVFANQSITMGNGAIMQGRAMSLNSFVQLNNNPITIPPPRFNSDISVTKTKTPGPYAVGSQITYTIVVKNLGPNNETNLLVSDLLPPGLTFISATTTNHTPYSQTTGFWSVDELNNGDSDTLTIVATITAPNFITNTATVAGDAIDNNQSNNASSVTICAVPTKPGVITGPAVLCIGGTGNTYSIAAVPGSTRYNWSVPTGWIITNGQNTNSISLLPGPDTASAVISVTAVNSCGESEPSTKRIRAIPPPPPVLPPIAGNPFPCRNSTGNVYSIPPLLAVNNYSWTVPTGWTITAGQGTNSITVTAGSLAGVISLTVSNDCGTSGPKTLNVNPATGPPALPGPITSNNAGDPCVSQVGLVYSVPALVNASTYSWTVPTGWTITAGQGTNSITVSAGANPGVISVFATNGCGNSPVATYIVNPVTAPPVVTGPITGQFVPCIGQTSITYSVPAQSGVGSYNWTVPAGWTITAGQGTNTITVTAGSSAGAVSVTATNGCGTGAAVAQVVTPATTVPPAPGAIVSTTGGNPCAGQTNLVYTLVPVSGASTYNWTVPAGWTITSGQGTSSITVTAGSTSGPISVVAVNGCGSSAASTLGLTPTTTPPPVPGNIAGNTVPCAGSTMNVYSIPVVSGASSYNWTVPAGWTITSGQGTNTITVTAGNSNGSISVTASNACGAGSASTSLVIAATAVPPVPGAITGNVNMCINQTGITYSIAPVNNASGYTWSVPAGWTITAGQGTNTVTVTAGTNPGNISVVATNGCGSGLSTALALVPITNPPATPGNITGNLVPCTGQSNVTYTIAPVTGATGYNWTVPAGWTITAGQGTTSITVTTGNNSGNVSVSATNSCGPGAPRTLNVTPSSTAAPAPGPITGIAIPCIGQTGLTYSIAAVAGASSYSWTVPAGWTINSGQGTISIQVTAGSVAGNISVVAANGCGTGIASTQAVQPTFTPPVAPGNIIGNSVPCSTSGNLTYSVLLVNSAYAYTWTVPAGWNIVSGQGTNSITVTPGTGAGTIAVTATNGCGTSPASSLNVMISTTAPPQPGQITAPFSGSPCAGQTGLVYSISPVVGASSYNWTLPTGWTLVSGQGTTSIQVTAGTSSGLVSVVASNGCGSSSASTLATTPTSKPPLTSGVIEGPLSPCTGNVATTYRTTGVNGATGYTWTVPLGWQITAGQGTTSITVTPGTKAGNVGVVAYNGCGAGTPSELNATPTNQPPVIIGNILGNTTLCADEKGVIFSIAGVAGADSFSWEVPKGWNIVSGQGTDSIVVNGGTNSGEVVVVAMNGCGASAATRLAVTVQVPLVFTNEIKDESSPCIGLRYSVDPIPGAVAYNWTVPADWQILSGAGTTSIVVKAGSAEGQISVVAQTATCQGLPIEAKMKASASDPDLKIPNAFSPNNDDVNEKWVVENLENYDENELTVINRWGNEVFRQKNYKNNWNGQGLSPGTYYYILQVKVCDNSEKTMKGYVMIVR
ncbi:ice-binding family protein [Adhaeribacter terreus]|uniref:Ice-binding family protein n=1 Tax=Adhaeribacter terreus TaxID=529703 RepID=A0ABW0ECU3_9BACT